MMRAFLLAVATVTLSAGAAFGGMIARWGPAGGDVPGSAKGTPYVLSQDALPDIAVTARSGFDANDSGTRGFINATQMGNFLAIAQSQPDRDEDGFVDTPSVGEVNPTGYVVFHFRDLRHNARLSLGGGMVLAASGSPLGDVGVGLNAGFGGHGPTSPGLFGWQNRLVPPAVIPPPPAPEPASILLLLAGGVLALFRQRRKTSIAR